MDSSDPHWHSHVQEPLIVETPDDANWHDSADVVVLGFGGAGAAAAIEAKESNASVIVIDRFQGGGATALSGGIYYAGGGTQYQQKNNYQDNADEMFKYLQMETEGVVKDSTLRTFCDQSLDNLDWLEGHGVIFDGTMSPVKTSYPSQKYYFYYSGNEGVPAYAEKAKPAPRGHRAVGKGLSGSAFYEPLKSKALMIGVKPYFQAQAQRLVVDAKGQVIGVEVRQIKMGSEAAKKHSRYHQIASKVQSYVPAIAMKYRNKLMQLEKQHAETRLIRAEKGLVLSAGGFIMNRKMVQHHAPKFRPALPLGNTGCDGSGIRLGQTVGGAVDLMQRVSGWRFINPPFAWATGIIVNQQGQRYVNEQCYGAKIGYHMVEENEGVGYLILDKKQFWKALSQALPGKIWSFQYLPVMLNSMFGSKKGKTLAELAGKLKVPVDALEKTVSDYNAGIQQGNDAFGKADEFCQAIEQGPFFALDIGVASKIFPLPTVTFGGLKVNEETGQVLAVEGEQAIPGLYAAGRNAVGVASNLYVSGLSIADCIFSGRRAARHICKP